jgi:hypothetical protein
VDDPDPELGIGTEPSEPPSRPVAAAPQKPETTETTLEEWRPAAADQLLAFSCCWPQLEEAAPLPQLAPEGGRPPAWPLALLPLGLYALWWIAKPRRVARRLTRPDRHNGRGTRVRHFRTQQFLVVSSPAEGSIPNRLNSLSSALARLCFH